MDKDEGVAAIIVTLAATIAQLYIFSRTIKPNQTIPPKEKDLKFEILAQRYDVWKNNKSEKPGWFSLPALGIYPKELPDVHAQDFYVSSSAFELFEYFERANEKYKQFKENRLDGYYLAGPLGVGKSSTLYTVATLAVSKQWIVFYVPNCDLWVSSPSPEHYLLKILEKCLAQFFNLPRKRTRGTWGQIIEEGLTDSTKQEKALKEILIELEDHTENPILLIFDEVNAIYRNNLEDTGFYQMAAKVKGGIELSRGWKLISGTGHGQFLSKIPNGMEQYVESLQPWEREDFKQLLSNNNVCPPKLYDVLNRNGSLNPKFADRICQTLGCVPRQLVYLGSILKLPGAPDDQNLSDLLSNIIKYYELKSGDTLRQLNYDYIISLDPIKRKFHLQNLFQSFVFSLADFLPEFMDLSLMYVKWSKGSRVIETITPTAAKVIIDNARQFYTLDEDPDMSTITNTTQILNEKTKAFERIVFRKILLVNFNITTTRIDGTDPQTINIHVHITQSIPEESLLPFPPEQNTLFIPLSSNYAIVDGIIVDVQSATVYAIQCTVSDPASKLAPTSTNPCIYDANRYKNLIGKNKDIKAKHLHKENYATELLALLNVPGYIRLDTATNTLVQYDDDGVPQPRCQVQFIVITTQELGKVYNTDITNKKWMRILHKEHLQNWFSPSFVSYLQN